MSGCLAAFRVINPLKKVTRMGIEVGGLLGLIILIGDVWAIINIIGSTASNGSKLVWTVVVVLLPVLGLIVWFFAGPRDRAA